MAKKVDEQNYQNLREELDQIIDELQAGNVGIEEALSKYERGQVIIKELETFLQQTDNTVTKLKAETLTEDES